MSSARWFEGCLFGAISALSVACVGLVEDPAGAGSLVDSRGPGAADGGAIAPGTRAGSGGSGSSVAPGNGGSPLGDGDDEPGAVAEQLVASSAYPRLSHKQWALSAQDLLQLDSAPDVTGFSADAPQATGFDNTGSKLEVSQGLWSDYQAMSETLAAQVAGTPAKLALITPAGLPSSGVERAQAFVSALGERAFRRPLSTAERDTYVTLFQQGATLFPGRDALSAGAELTIQALLQSPAFIYRAENANTAAADGVAALSDYEIASKLSYMLTDGLPDAQLTAAAKSGQLHTPDQIATHATRLLASPRAADKLLDFHRQLLELRNYDNLHPKDLPSTIGAALRSETERFIAATLVDDGGSFKDLLTADYSFVNSATASLYGLTGSFGADFVRTKLAASERAGLLTQPGFLISHSGDTAPILRGVFVNLKLLCADLPPPPVFTPPTMTGTTRRERVDSITGKGTCGQSCHAGLINPAGFPLEYFDDQGHYRTQDSGRAVDGTASYTFKDGTSQSFNGPVEWSRVLAGSQQAHECYVRHWLEFGFGRGYASGDAALVQRVAAASRGDDRSVKELLVLLVQSPSFRSRLAEAL